ncbi:unnamed protein product [Boreogadus saida]
MISGSGRQRSCASWCMVSTSSQKKERLRQVVIRWMETNEEANDPDQGQTAPDQGQTAPDQGQTTPDQGQTAPDPGQTAADHDQTAPDRGQTPDEPADRALRTDLSQVTGNTRTRLRGLRELWAETHTIALPDEKEKKPLGRPPGLNPFPGQTAPDQDQTAPDRGQTAPDQVQTPDEPADRALRKDLSQVTGNTRTRLRGLRELWAETHTIALPDQQEEKPLGRPPGLIPVPGQTAPDRVQTAPHHGQTAPDRGQTASDHGQTAPDRVQTAPNQGQTAPDRGQTAPDQVQTDQKEKPLGRPSGLNPLGDIKTATQQAEGKGLRSWMHVL